MAQDTVKWVNEAKVFGFAEQALAAANRFLIERVGDACCAGNPVRVVFAIRALWIVPVLLFRPVPGLFEQLGMVAVDEELGTVVGHTPFEEMEERLREFSDEKDPIAVTDEGVTV